MRYLICIFLIYCCCFANAQAEAGSPYFEVSGSEAGAGFPLTATSASVNIVGVIADVTVRQTYVNQSNDRLEATYVFPGSTSAAVHGLTMIIGNCRIEGVVQRKAEARATYEAAKAEGKRASLLEQHRPNVFQTSVANILPGDTIEVELRYTELLVPENGTYRFVYPTVVGPRYTGESDGTTTYTAQPYTKGKPSYAFALDVYLNAGMPVGAVGSPTHRIATARAEEATTIQLAGSEADGGNRDFVLEYDLEGQHIQTGMLLFEGEKENYFLYMAQPPAETTDKDYPPREFIFVVDVSGSMNGFPLDVSKKLLTELIGQLRPADQFNVVLFAGASQTWQQESQFATTDNLESALAFLQSARGGGGTQLLSALNTAYALPRATVGLSRNLVVVTDGYINVEPEAFDLVRKNLNQANVYSFGIGSGVNRHLIEGMARIGKGRPAFVLDPSEADVEADRFRRYISEPVLTEMTLDVGDQFEAYDIEPIALPDLSRERPLVVFGKYKGKAKGKLALTGYGGYPSLDSPGIEYDAVAETEAESRKRTFSFHLKDAVADDRHAALARLWARERIRRLDDYNNLRSNDDRIEEVTQLGLEYNLLTQYTSFVAVEEVVTADPNDPLNTVKQPLPLPENVSATAVGFSLGLTGVAGLPAMTMATPWFAWVLLGILGGLLCWLVFVGSKGNSKQTNPFLTRKGNGTNNGGRRARPFLTRKGSGYGVSKGDGWGMRLFGRSLGAILLLGLLLSLSSCDVTRDGRLMAEAAPPQTLDYRAATITFILGEDEGTNAYYARAEEYFRYHPEEAGEYVITDVHSLQGVHNYLRDNRPQGGPWQKVNLVVHGNQWTGLALPLHPAPAAQRTTSDQLSAWKPARPLPKSHLTEETELVVHGCSVGRDSSLLLHLSRAFAARGGRYPSVSASTDFTLFREGVYGMERHYAEYYFRATPLGKYPLRKVMANRFRRQHPDKRIDWDEALATTRFASELKPHLYQFNVPVQWTRVYPQRKQPAAPDNPDTQDKWLAGEPELITKLGRMGISPRKFDWNFSAEAYELADGSSLPAVTATGVARLFCVLVPREGEPEMVKLRWG